MTRCQARTRKGMRCQNDAIYGGLCLLHEAMPSDAGRIAELKTEARKLGYALVMRGEYRALVNEAEMWRQHKERGAEGPGSSEDYGR